MAKKQESTKDQVVRLYKEGYDLDGVAKTMGLTKGAVRNLLDKYMPEWESFEQPVLDNPSADENEKGIKSKLNIPVSSLFKKKKKEDDEVTVVKTGHKDSSINLEMNESGFVEKTTAAIAEMINRGKDEKTISEFFSCDIADVEAVKDCMEKHKAELEAKQNEPEPEQPVEEEIFNPFITGKLKRDTNLSKLANEEIAEYVPHIDNADDASDEMPSISTDNLVFEDPVQPAVIDAIDEAEVPQEPVIEIEAVPAVAPVAAEVEMKESDSEMTPMEKMKQFAKEQIDINNQKIEVLKAQKEEAAQNTIEIEKTLAESKSQLADVTAQISESEAQIIEYNAQLSELNAKLTEVRTKLAELQINEAKLTEENEKTAEATKSAAEAALEIDKSIAEIEKENEEFMAYFK